MNQPAEVSVRETAPRAFSYQSIEKGTTIMNLTTTTQVSVDGVMQGPGARDEDESGVFERGVWAHFDNEAGTVMDKIYQRAGRTRPFSPVISRPQSESCEPGRVASCSCTAAASCSGGCSTTTLLMRSTCSLSPWSSERAHGYSPLPDRTSRLTWSTREPPPAD